MWRDFFGVGGHADLPEVGGQQRILLYDSEADRIARFALSSPGVEIGGDLFGFFAPEGTPLVFVASGPGPAAQRDRLHFQQDPDFQARIFKELASEFRLFYLGDWHSHHELDLSQPSGPDDAKLNDLAAKNGWMQLFSLIVQTGSAPSRQNPYAGHKRGRRARDSAAESSATPVEAHGVFWNAFHYVFRSGKYERRRVAVEFQSGHNPFVERASRIGAPLEVGVHEAAQSSQAAAKLSAPAGAHAAESIIATYQQICKVLTGELPSARMEVDLARQDFPSLLVIDLGREVACTVREAERGTATVTIEPDQGDRIDFGLPSTRGFLDPAGVRTIAFRIADQLRAASVWPLGGEAKGTSGGGRHEKRRRSRPLSGEED
jgi:hypothetical protein